MSIYAGTLMILVCDDTRQPNWYPLRLFEVAESGIQNDWHFALYDDDASYLQALWGYRELVEDESHYNLLLERDPGALRIFYKYGP